jgi:hypothetical protein
LRPETTQEFLEGLYSASAKAKNAIGWDGTIVQYLPNSPTKFGRSLANRAELPLYKGMQTNCCIELTWPGERNPALDRLGIERDGLHALRYCCNTRWQLAGLAPVVIRQQMGHSSSDMTDHYTSTLSPEQVQAAFQSKFGRKIDVLENDGKRESVSIAA